MAFAAAVFLWLRCPVAAQIPGQTAPPTPAPPVGETPQPGQIMQPVPVEMGDMTPLDQDRRPPSWDYSVGVSEAYESNPQGTPGGGASDTLTRVAGSVGRSWMLRRGSASFSGSASDVYYSSGNGPDSFNYGVGFGFGYMLTHRISWHAGESLSSVMSLDSAVLAGSGLASPNLQTRTNVLSTGISYQASPKVQVDVSASETSVGFPGGELSNGSSLTLQSRVTRTIGRDQLVGFSVGNTFSTGQTGDIQGILGLWQRTIGRWTLNASGGIRPYQLYGEPGTKFAPGGSFAVNKRLIRGQSFSGSYEYAVEQAFGFNRTHLANRFNAGYGQAVGRSVKLEAGLSYGINTYPQIPNYHLGGWTATLNGRYIVARQLSIGVNYGFWNTFETGQPQFNNYRAGIFVSYGGAFR